MFTEKQLAAAYKKFEGKVVIAKMEKPRLAEKTFRNNKYSVFNRGRMASQYGKGGTYSTVDKI
jgi:uncharacterized protein YktA (UPF0223 family)